MFGKLDIHRQVMKLDDYFTLSKEINSKWIKYKNSFKNCKTPRRKCRKKVPWLWSWQWFFRYDTKSKSKKGKINKWDYIKQNLFTGKKNQQMKRQLMYWKKILQTMCLIRNIYQKYIRTHSTRSKTSNPEGQRNCIDIFPKKIYK